MKRSEEPTEYLFIKAYTQSEWDYCDFAIIHLTEQSRNIMRKRLDLLNTFEGDEAFCSHHYWDAPQGYYTNIVDDDEGADIAELILNEGEEWAFVTLDAHEPDSFPIPESRLDAHQFVLTKYGSARFTAYGKHTGEEFYTASFGLAEFVNAATAEAIH